ALTTADEKNIQGIRPAKRNTGKGIPSLGALRSVEKTKVSTRSWAAGFRNIQAEPSMDCLYWLLTLRAKRWPRSSRWRQTLRQSRGSEPLKLKVVSRYGWSPARVRAAPPA